MTLLFSLTSCGKRKDDNVEVTEDDSTVVFTFGENKITTAEVYIYITSVKERYEIMYGADVWDVSLPEGSEGTISMVDLTKERVVEEIVRVKTLYDHASDYGIALTELEETTLSEEASEFYKGLTDEDIERMEMDETLIYQVLVENKIAKKVEAKMLENDPVEISDEQARMTTFYDLYFPCYIKDLSGGIKELSEEEKEENYDLALDACAKIGTAALNEKENEWTMEQLAEEYQLTEAREQTLSPEEILNIYGNDIYTLLYSMENGEYTTVIESEYGYHVFQMRALTNQRATSGKKEQMLEDAVAERLDEIMMKWQKDIDSGFSYPASVNMDVYDTISGM